MLLSRFEILAKAISIASTSLQQRESIFLALFLQCPHCSSNHPELFCKKGVLKNFSKFTGAFSGTSVSCKFCKILRNTFFHRIPPVDVSGIAPIEMSYSNTVCNKLAAEVWYVSFQAGKWRSERLLFCMCFPQNDHFLH